MVIASDLLGQYAVYVAAAEQAGNIAEVLRLVKIVRDDLRQYVEAHGPKKAVIG